jgi:Anti-sigma-K factor rskA
MTHAEARELLELAAAEPNGFDRLAAGDTAESGALAGHLAGCDTCREEYARLSRTAQLLRSSLSTLPPADLRERTLQRVTAEGRARAAGGAPAPLAPTPLGGVAPRADRTRTLAWLGSLAAAIAIAVGLSWAVVARPLADEARAARESTTALSHLTGAAIAVGTQPDARHVALTSTGGAVGTLAFSPSSRELVVVSTGLEEPSGTAEYRCWVESNGQRTVLGKMYFVSGIAAWEGQSDAIASVPAGARFGVSLSPGGDAGEAQPVLSGTLAAS